MVHAVLGAVVDVGLVAVLCELDVVDGELFDPGDALFPQAVNTAANPSAARPTRIDRILIIGVSSASVTAQNLTRGCRHVIRVSREGLSHGAGRFVMLVISVPPVPSRG